MITTCTTCGKCYEAGSEEQANEQVRPCPACWQQQKAQPRAENSRRAKLIAGCVRCAAKVPATRHRDASTVEMATDIAAAEDVVDPHAVPLVALGPDSTDRTAAARAMADSSERPFQGSADHHAVLDLMEAMGGSFVSALAVAWRRADEFNHARLYKAFGHYYREYREHLYAGRQRRGGAV